MREVFADRAWLAIELHRGASDAARVAMLLRLAADCDLPAVAAGDVHMHRRSRRRLQDVLTATRHGCTLNTAGERLFANGERHLRPLSTLERLYPPALLAQSVAIAERCDFCFDQLRYEYPSELVPEGQSASEHLRALTVAGTRQRWPQGTSLAVSALIERELILIAELRYEHFFLTVHDIVRFARERGILCQGRGSAANSAVCYALGITEVDPARMSVLFERFISRERREPPDIDVDFENERREEVIQYIYRKYGRERTALAATVITYRSRSARRDVMRALGISETEVSSSPRAALLEELSAELRGFPRHLSQHVGGFVISGQPLHELVPVENAAMPERTVLQWDKDDLEAMGLLKVDVLALGMLTAIRRALELTHVHRGWPRAVQDIPAEDAATYEMICRADTVGVFQIESRAQMSMLPRLRPQNYYDLVIEAAIVRPGPIQGEMVHPYLRRRSGEEAVTYPSKEVEAVLKRTLGVPIFQEQVMQLAIVAAGFSPGEADRLRRAMAAWKRKGGLEPFQRQLIDGMRERGYPESFAQQIFNQILGFGEYGFPECVVGETRVVDADSGRWLTIDEIVSGRACLNNTLACDEDLRLRKRKVMRGMCSGVKPVLRLRTALGHEIVATAEHPFMTMTGWLPLGKLKVGGHVATARSVPVRGRRRWPRHKVLVLADLIAEGNLCHPNTFYFYTTESWHRDEFIKAVERFPNTRAVVERHKACFSVRVRRIDRKRQVGAVTWLRALGVWGCGARAKQLPPEVFELCNSNIALLLAHLWEGDGGFSMKGHASYDTASRSLASQLQHLLLRLGIVARIYRRSRLYRGRKLEHQVVTVTGEEPLRQFWHYIGRRFLDPKKRRQSSVLAIRRNGRMSRDIIPMEVRAIIRG